MSHIRFHIHLNDINESDWLSSHHAFLYVCVCAHYISQALSYCCCVVNRRRIIVTWQCFKRTIFEFGFFFFILFLIMVVTDTWPSLFKFVSFFFFIFFFLWQQQKILLNWIHIQTMATEMHRREKKTCTQHFVRTKFN